MPPPERAKNEVESREHGRVHITGALGRYIHLDTAEHKHAGPPRVHGGDVFTLRYETPDSWPGKPKGPQPGCAADLES